LATASTALAAAGLPGCVPASDSSGYLEKVWGKAGQSAGKLQKPRAIAINEQDEIYVVDMTGRVQAFTREGEYLRGWRTPEIYNGKSSGLSFNHAGELMVADTHYFRVLFYTPEGTLLKDRTIGGVAGQAPGEFGFVTDAVQDSQGRYHIAEYGEFDRIQSFDSQGKFLRQWGGHGDQQGDFIRPQNLDIDDQDRLWVADACNHRIQVFDVAGDTPNLVACWGEHGAAPGKLSYPYDLVLDGNGALYVCEFGNHRIQKFTLEGEFLGAFGGGGRREGELYQPWGLVQDSQGAIHVLDTYNHRVQRVRL